MPRSDEHGHLELGQLEELRVPRIAALHRGRIEERIRIECVARDGDGLRERHTYHGLVQEAHVLGQVVQPVQKRAEARLVHETLCEPHTYLDARSPRVISDAVSPAQRGARNQFVLIEARWVDMDDAVRKAALDPLLERVARIDTRRHADNRKSRPVAPRLDRVQQAVEERLARALRKLFKGVEYDEERALRLLGIVGCVREEHEDVREGGRHRREDSIGHRLARAAVDGRLGARRVFVVRERHAAIELRQVHALGVRELLRKHRIERRRLLLAERALRHELLREFREALPVGRVQEPRESDDERRRRGTLTLLGLHAAQHRMDQEALAAPVLAEQQAAVAFLCVDGPVQQRIQRDPRLLESNALLPRVRLGACSRRERRREDRERRLASARGAPVHREKDRRPMHTRCLSRYDGHAARARTTAGAARAGRRAALRRGARGGARPSTYRGRGRVCARRAARVRCGVLWYVRDSPDRFLADAAAHAEFAELFLASGVLAQRHTSPLHAEAAADRPTDALLAALRHELSIGTSAHVLLLAYELVLRAGEHNPNVFRWLLYAPNAECLLPGLLRRLTHNVWAGHYAGQSRAVSDVGSVAPALPLPGAALRAAQPPRVDGHVSSEGLQVWLQYKALALLYELLCTVRLRAAELGTCRADAGCIRGPFVCHLFDEAEATREHEDETLGVLVTQLLLALHEQYLATLQGPAAAPFSILAVIRERAHATRTFAENLVFMLNRTPSTDAGGCRFHLLVLKLLDALFAMPETASYFYVNDLKVLVDIFLRQITDLAEHRELLRQVYLRVFPALLTQTQLCTVPYKREDIVYVLTTIVRDGAWSNTAPRTVELARRCLATEWCVDPSATPIVAPIGGGTAHPEALVEEQTRRGAVFHAETSDAAIHTLLKLGQMQSAAAATAAWDDAWPLWPPAPAEAEAPVAELDVLTLEQLDSGRASPQSSASSRGTRRRAPPPPPVEAGQRRAAPTPPLEPARRAAPTPPLEPARRAVPTPPLDAAPRRAAPTPPRTASPSVPDAAGAPSTSSRRKAPSIPTAAAAPERRRFLALFRKAPKAPAAAPPPQRRAAPKPPIVD